ncbi:MAG: PEP/pyruvate-binding domain-containing protein [Dehalococcoidales bacterium]|nr:PEP/pyruvate-binding domain-containing protein [Dehalococcoidales bacterium]
MPFVFGHFYPRPKHSIGQDESGRLTNIIVNIDPTRGDVNIDDICNAIRLLQTKIVIEAGNLMIASSDEGVRKDIRNRLFLSEGRASSDLAMPNSDVTFRQVIDYLVVSSAEHPEAAEVLEQLKRLLVVYNISIDDESGLFLHNPDYEFSVREEIHQLVVDYFIKKAHDSGMSELVTEHFNKGFESACRFLSEFSQWADSMGIRIDIDLGAMLRNLALDTDDACPIGRVCIIKKMFNAPYVFEGHSSRKFGINIVYGSRVDEALVHEFFAWLSRADFWHKKGHIFSSKMVELYVMWRDILPNLLDKPKDALTDAEQENLERYSFLRDELRQQFFSEDLAIEAEVESLVENGSMNGINLDVYRAIIYNSEFYDIPGEQRSFHRSFLVDRDDNRCTTYLHVHDLTNKVTSLVTGIDSVNGFLGIIAKRYLEKAGIGDIRKQEVEDAGLAWEGDDGFVQIMLKNGWAVRVWEMPGQIDSTRICLAADLEQEKPRMADKFGNDFTRVMPILEAALGWVNIFKILVQNGWAEQLGPTEVRIIVDPQEAEDEMLKALGKKVFEKLRDQILIQFSPEYADWPSNQEFFTDSLKDVINNLKALKDYCQTFVTELGKPVLAMVQASGGKDYEKALEELMDKDLLKLVNELLDLARLVAADEGHRYFNYDERVRILELTDKIGDILRTARSNFMSTDEAELSNNKKFLYKMLLRIFFPEISPDDLLRYSGLLYEVSKSAPDVIRNMLVFAFMLRKARRHELENEDIQKMQDAQTLLHACGYDFIRSLDFVQLFNCIILRDAGAKVAPNVRLPLLPLEEQILKTIVQSYSRKIHNGEDSTDIERRAYVIYRQACIIKSIGFCPRPVLLGDEEDDLAMPARSNLPQVQLIPKLSGETVGRLRIIYDIVKDYEQFWKIAEDEIVALVDYPCEDPTMSRPMGIISATDPGGNSHAQVRAGFWRIPHAIVNDLRELEGFNGEWVYMNVTKEGVEFRPATEEEIANWQAYKPKPPKPELAEVCLGYVNDIVSPMFGFRIDDPAVVSHKFASLYAVDHGAPSVNFGPVITFAAYRRALDANPGLEDKLRLIIESIDDEDIDDIRNKLAQAQELIMNLEIPRKMWEQIQQTAEPLTENRTKGLFVRTGTNAEDLPDYPGLGAGVYGTCSNVMFAELEAAIKECWASIWNFGAYNERRKLGLDHFAIYPAVQITRAIDADYAFVINTADTEEQNTDIVIIEIVQGLGESLVGDKYPGIPHRYIYDKKSKSIIKFDAGTKLEKAVLDDKGGTRRVPVDHEQDEFVRDGQASEMAKYLGGLSVAIEKSLKRPQDIEGVIENGGAIMLQSRSQAGYEKYPTEWDEFVREHRQWALDLIAKHRGMIQQPDCPDRSFEDTVDGIFKKPGSDKKLQTHDEPELSRIIRLFMLLGDDGIRFAAKLFICGRGYHQAMLGIFNRMHITQQIQLLSYAVVDYDMFTQIEEADFIAISNFNIARIVRAQEEDYLRVLLTQLGQQQAAFILEEVHQSYSECDVGSLMGGTDFTKTKEPEMNALIKEIYAGYSEEQKAIFNQYASHDLCWIAFSGWPESSYPKLPDEFKPLFDELRYYRDHQVIVLSAQAIDGSYALSTLFSRLDMELRKDTFVFMILMDIPGEHLNDFLRRNHLSGKNFGTEISPDNITDGLLTKAIKNARSSREIKLYEIKENRMVLVARKEALELYQHPESGLLGVEVKPEPGQLPVCIMEAR